MDFKVYYEDNVRFVEMEDILNHLKDLGVEQAFQSSDTGFHLALISMSKNDIAHFESEKYKEIKVERIS